MNDRIKERCVRLMRNGKPYGKIHIVSPYGDNDRTACGVLINYRNWFVYDSDMSRRTFEFKGCKKCGQWVD